MEHLDEFGALREKFQDAADFVTIYITEAHPTEQVTSVYCIYQSINIMIVFDQYYI